MARSRSLLPLAVLGLLLVVAGLALPPVRQGVRLTRLFFSNDGTPARWLVEETSVALPFERKGHVLLPVRVNNGPTLQFALDTGAPFPGIVGGPHTDGLALKLGGSIPIGGSGSGGAAQGRVVRDLTFSLGPVELLEQAAVLIPWEEMRPLFASPAEVYIEGILGYDLLRRYVVELDFEREILTLHRPDGFRYDGDGDVLELSFTQRKPYVTAWVTMVDGAEVPVKLHVDVGQTAALSLIPGSAPGISVPANTVQSEGWGLSGRVDKLMGRVRELRFGRQRLADVICSFPLRGHATAGGRQGVVGLAALSRFRVFLDYPRKRMILERTAVTDEPFEADMSGAAFTPHGETYVLKRLRAESPAAEAGLQEGDLLVSLDGIPAGNLRMRDVQERLRARDGETVRVEVRRGQTVVAAELTLRRRV